MCLQMDQCAIWVLAARGEINVAAVPLPVGVTRAGVQIRRQALPIFKEIQRENKNTPFSPKNAGRRSVASYCFSMRNFSYFVPG